MLYIEGRTDTPLYRVESPWSPEQRVGYMHDTTEPIASITLPDLKITIHNFPFDSYERSIPPQAQVQRWIRQLGNKEYVVTSAGHSGFVGLLLESEEMIAAAFQLSPYYRAKLAPSESTADWTIKATGQVQKYREEILRLINSFELIDTL